MSKSLKNFITIREFLQQYSANLLRVFCLDNHYSSNIHYSPDRMTQAESKLSKLSHTFRQVEHLKAGKIRIGIFLFFIFSFLFYLLNWQFFLNRKTKKRCNFTVLVFNLSFFLSPFFVFSSLYKGNWCDDDKNLLNNLHVSKNAITNYLATDFNTTEALRSIIDLSQQLDHYLESSQTSNIGYNRYTIFF